MLIPKRGIQGGIKHLGQAGLLYWSKAGMSLLSMPQITLLPITFQF